MEPPQILLQGHTATLFERELSWLAFNRRSLYAAAVSSQPLLQRVLQLAQTSADLDEYFMVKVPHLVTEEVGRTAAAYPRQQQLRAIVSTLKARQQAHFTHTLNPQLARQGITILTYAQLSELQRQQLRHRFEDEIAPVLTPLITLPGRTPPYFSNLSLNLGIWLGTPEAPSRSAPTTVAWVKVPRSLPRFLRWPGAQPQSWCLIPLEEVIAAHSADLFPEATVQGAFSFRVTRSADLGNLEAVADSWLEQIQESLQARQQSGSAVRLEVTQAMPPWMATHLLHHLDLDVTALYRQVGWLGLADLREIIQLPRPDLKLPPWQPKLPQVLETRPQRSSMVFRTMAPAARPTVFQLLQQQDLLLHFPYHSFQGTVEHFIAEAAQDAAVLSIKMTLYRTSGDTPIARSLMAAAKAGKQVVVLVELTAAFDEAINIHWAKNLEKAGAHVVYGIVGLKTHTNLALVVRQEASGLRQYAYIGTGDYLPDRPQPYEDLGLLTCCPTLSTDLCCLFNFLTGYSRQVTYQAILVAPDSLRSQIKQIIHQETQQALAGQPARLVVKLNLLADPDIINTLYEASQAGVTVDLLIRGVCRLRPGVPGLSDRIRVFSLLGRYVEHSRILYCYNNGNPQAWIGTADWTPRGLDERVEVMAPIRDPHLIQAIEARLQCWFADTEQTWILQPDGRYVQRSPDPGQPGYSAQATFMAQAAQQGRTVAP